MVLLLDNNRIYYLYLTSTKVYHYLYLYIYINILLVNPLLLVSSPLLLSLPSCATYVPHPDSGSILLLILLLRYPALVGGILGSSSLLPLPLKSIMLSVFISITFIFSFLFSILFVYLVWRLLLRCYFLIHFIFSFIVSFVLPLEGNNKIKNIYKKQILLNKPSLLGENIKICSEFSVDL